ncbi:hypothetical protein FPV67DRAFT_1502972 [Lyophyllum atratum]|nr:hypothetical protein FPV67DRAFT_1502972 [Lyophyllum atratum]
MASTTGHYDQNLLAAAPAATKAQLQEGYTTDLLDPNHGKATPPPSSSQADPERGHVKEYAGYTPSRALPFWRTRKGIIIIFIAAVVILAAVIGGAVGGTARKKSPSPASSGESGGNSAEVGGTETRTVSQATVTATGANTGTNPSPTTTSPPPASTSSDSGLGQDNPTSTGIQSIAQLQAFSGLESG